MLNVHTLDTFATLSKLVQYFKFTSFCHRCKYVLKRKFDRGFAGKENWDQIRNCPLNLHVRVSKFGANVGFVTVAIDSKYSGKKVFATRLLSIQIHFFAQCYIQATDNTAPQLFHCMLTIVESYPVDSS